MSKEYTAFDYDKQEWLTGEPARLLKIKQWRQELVLLESDGGQRYLDSVRKRNTPRVLVADAIARNKQFIQNNI